MFRNKILLALALLWPMTSYASGGGGGAQVITVQNLDGTITSSNAAGVVTISRPALTGDVSVPSASNASTLATVNSSVGACGSSTGIPTVTLNAKGLSTACSTNAVIAPAGTLTGSTLAAGVTASSLTSVGTIGNLTVTNPIIGSIMGNAATVTTNANLTGNVTSVGNATTIGAGQVTNSMLAGSISASKLVGTDIATVGTITSGTWNGTSIGATYLPTATSSTFGIVKPDNSTITISGGVISAASASASNINVGTTTITGGGSGHLLGNVSGKVGDFALGSMFTNTNNTALNTTEFLDVEVGTTSYAIPSADAGGTVLFNAAAASTVTVGSAGATGYTLGFGVGLVNTGTSNITFTPGSPSTINGAASVVIPPTSALLAISDGTNYWSGAGSTGTLLQFAGNSSTSPIVFGNIDTNTNSLWMTPIGTAARTANNQTLSATTTGVTINMPSGTKFNFDANGTRVGFINSSGQLVIGTSTLAVVGGTFSDYGNAVIGADFLGTAPSTNGLTVEGNVSIGTAGSSAFPIAIYNASGYTLNLGASCASSDCIYPNAGDMDFNVPSGNKYRWEENAAVNMVLSSGGLAIGSSTNVNNGILSVAGSGQFGADYYAAGNTAPTNGLLVEGNVSIGTTAKVSAISAGSLTKGAMLCVAPDGGLGHCASGASCLTTCTCTCVDN